MTGRYCRRCNVVHPPLFQAVPVRDSWLPDVRDILLSALTGFGVVAGLLWLVTA